MHKVKSKIARINKNSPKTINEFREAHDKAHIIPKRIREGLKQLGPKGWEYEGDFIRRCNLSNADFSKYRDQFSDFIVPIQGKARNAARAWAGSVALANEMRDMVA